MLLSQFLRFIPSLALRSGPMIMQLRRVEDFAKASEPIPGTVYLCGSLPLVRRKLPLWERQAQAMKGICIVTPASSDDNPEQLTHLASNPDVAWVEYTVESSLPLDLGIRILHVLMESDPQVGIDLDALRDELVEELLLAEDHRDGLEERVKALGVDITRANRVMIVGFADAPMRWRRSISAKFDPPALGSRLRLLRFVRGHIAGSSPQHSAHQVADGIVVLLDKRLEQEHDMAKDLVLAARGAFPDRLVVGALGGIPPDPLHLSQSYRQARWALEVVVESPIKQPVLSFDEARFPILLREINHSAKLRELVLGALSPLEVVEPHYRRRLVETIEAYLRHNRSVTRAARSLEIHANTLKYRLRRISELLPIHSETIDMQIVLYMAAHLDKDRQGTRPFTYCGEGVE